MTPDDPASRQHQPGEPYGRRTRPGEEPGLRRAIAAAERAITTHLRRSIRGVSVFSFGAVELYPGTLAFWVRTATDAQRDALLSDRAGFEATLRQLVGQCGYPEDCLSRVGFTAESEETVDRDHGGNWYYAVK